MAETLFSKHSYTFLKSWKKYQQRSRLGRVYKICQANFYCRSCTRSKEIAAKGGNALPEYLRNKENYDLA